MFKTAVKGSRVLYLSDPVMFPPGSVLAVAGDLGEITQSEEVTVVCMSAFGVVVH